MSGIIVDARSGLAQFEIRQYSDGVTDKYLPHVVWVDRSGPIRSDGVGLGCNCTGPFWPIRDSGGANISCPLPGRTPSVCLCMGKFIE